MPAIRHMAPRSEDEGTAIAKVFFANRNPAGRLLTTWPASMDQLPPMMDYNIRATAASTATRTLASQASTTSRNCIGMALMSLPRQVQKPEQSQTAEASRSPATEFRTPRHSGASVPSPLCDSQRLVRPGLNIRRNFHESGPIWSELYYYGCSTL